MTSQRQHLQLVRNATALLRRCAVTQLAMPLTRLVPSPPGSLRHALASIVVAALAGFGSVTSSGCADGAGIGGACESHDDCRTALQCASNVCIALCRRALDCGDGAACTAGGYCVAGTSRAGDTCITETACGPGLACVLDRTDVDHDGVMQATCAPDRQGHALGSPCDDDSECRNGTCGLGHCIDLCVNDRDCGAGQVCTSVPRVEAGGAQFFGCLVNQGTLTFELPVQGAVQKTLLAVPGNARSVSLLMTLDDQNQRVGLTKVVSPRGRLLYTLPIQQPDYYGNLLRHIPDRGLSVALLPSSLDTEFEHGPYSIELQSFRLGQPGSATPRTTVAMKMGDGALLDLHLKFADLAEHPCRDQLIARNGVLNAESARRDADFQQYFISTLRTLLGRGSVTIGDITFEDVAGHPELDAITQESAGALFAQTKTADGVTLYFVRSIAPAGLAAIGANPGPVGLPGTSRSGIALTMEAMCYRSWSQVARTAAHEIAGYLGLFPNRDIDDGLDPISDTDDGSENLMFYSELGGTVLSSGQGQIMQRSPALR